MIRRIDVLLIFTLGTWLAGTAVAVQVVAVQETSREMWRGDASDPCRIALSSDETPVEVLALGDGPAILTGTGSDLGLEASLDDGVTRLHASGGDTLELRLPAECDLAVDTVTGAVTYWVADEGAQTSVQLATSGEITVDFSVEIDYRHHQEPAKHGLLRLGHPSRQNDRGVHDDGSRVGRQVELNSRRGAIRVLRHPN